MVYLPTFVKPTIHGSVNIPCTDPMGWVDTQVIQLHDSELPGFDPRHGEVAAKHGGSNSAGSGGPCFLL